MRAIWSGSIGFGLVNIPVKIYSAVQDSGLDLDMLDGKTGSHIKFKRVSEDSGKEVPWEQIVKAYNYHNKYVMLEDADFEAASPKKSRVIEIESFVDIRDIDGAYFETPYFIEPGNGGEKAYQLLLSAMEKSGKAGLSRFVLRSKEHLALVRPKENYLMLQQLRFEEEMRSPEDLKIDADVRLSSKELSVAIELIKQYSAPFEIGQFKDEYRNELLKIIKAKAGGKKIVAKKIEITNTQQEDLFEQLRASLSNPPKKRAS